MVTLRQKCMYNICIFNTNTIEAKVLEKCRGQHKTCFVIPSIHKSNFFKSESVKIQFSQPYIKIGITQTSIYWRED